MSGFSIQVEHARLRDKQRLAKWLGTTVLGLRTYYTIPRPAWYEKAKVRNVAWPVKGPDDPAVRY